MARFLSQGELYATILQKSLETKEILWVCSPYLGSGCHKVFSQEILINPPTDIRFIFPVNDVAVKGGEVDPYEIQYLTEHFRGINIKSHDTFHSNMFIFDNSALVTSANLTVSAFENNIEVGVLLDGADAEAIRSYFNESLWNTAKPVGPLKKYKLMWNLAQKTLKTGNLKKAKPHTEIGDWTNAYINTWYIGVSKWLSKKTVRMIKKETVWLGNLSVVGDVGYHPFTQLKLGDYAYIADSSKRGKIGVALVRISDKARVETDEGDLHCAYETQKTFSLNREQFYEMLKNANISSKTSEIILNGEQVKQITNALGSIKRKRKRKSKARDLGL
jgi:hypothetical protein